ncbi:PD40 domain-containing protein [bacterium]|nr:PD40 domain-containing protein [bacterium]
MKFRILITLFLLLGQNLFAQNMWMWNQRTHPELKWQTLETEHFNIHFHDGIENIAHKAALIAEQAYQPTLDQLHLADFGKTDLVFSAEDEIMNGFAVPTDQIFIWVSQNDVAGNFGGSEKWLKLVVTHEFQHVVQFHAQRTWAGIFGAISIPSWWMEGMAEYMTEVWRVGRSDSRMKIHTYRNTMDQLDAHDDGYAKVLYLAWKYGDSTLVKISKHRQYLKQDSQEYPYWYNFGTAFEEVTGQKLRDFDEEWRRVMNTYYYGYKSQKEMIEEVGEPLSLKGFFTVRSATIAPDSMQVAVVGRKHSGMRDYSLYTMTTDSTHRIEEVHHGHFSGFPAWSPDTKQLVIAEYHRGRHGSMLNDLRLVTVDTKETSWLTQNLRALHPVFSHDGKGVFFVAHPQETTQIYYQDLSSNKRVQISKFVGDVQLQSLNLAPDGQRLTFMIQEQNGDVNIAVIGRDGQEFQKVTDDPEEDVLPVWTSAGNAIVYTSFRNSTPNLFRIELDSFRITQMTDVAEGIYSRQRLPGTDKIIATTLADVDTVRIRAVSAKRQAPDLNLNIRDPFMGWRSKSPDISLPEIDYNYNIELAETHPYQALKTFRPLLRLVLPDVAGLFGMAAYNDALGKHLIQGGALMDWSGNLAGGYLGYTNLKFGPVLNFYASQNFSFNIRRTWGQTHFEVLDGFGFIAVLPMNSGNSLSSNHTLMTHLRTVERTVIEIEDSEWVEDNTFPGSQETNLGFTWRWLNRRPEADLASFPQNGMGLLAHAESTIPQIWGDADYQKLWFEGFFNLKIPKTPLVLYNRSKLEYHSGNILAQDSIGFMSTAPLYFSAGTLMNFAQTGILDLPESYNLRGQIQDYPSAELIYNVSELRLALLKSLPAHIFGLRFTGLTGALFHDLGYLPETGETLTTMGAELKFNLSIDRLALITLSTGVGGDENYWDPILKDPEKLNFKNDYYFRLALVNPF